MVKVSVKIQGLNEVKKLYVNLPKKMNIERENDIAFHIDTVVEVLKEGKDKDFFVALKKIADDHLE